MRRLLESIIHNRKLYNRPQDEWTCGRADEGCPCIFGPGRKGECRATSQCQPARKGDRWVCTRQISLGGACATGPMPDGKCGCPVPPCQPKRSLRGHRRRLTWFAIFGALGGAILILGGKNRAEWNSPGPITSQHATSAQRCTDCHAEPNLPPLTPAGVLAHQHVQNQKCLNCHELGAQPAMPHGASAARLAQLTAAHPADHTGPAILAVARTLSPTGTELACASCHSEHHGRDFDLRRMGNQECQTCHQRQFASFAEGHPEFTSYPYERRTRLQFDHQTHWQKHFNDSKFAGVAPTSCTVCHEPVEDGRQMRVKSFEQTCAACHGAQIAGEGQAGDKGIPFFRLPAFDLATLRAEGIATGDYPEFAEGTLTPFMRWMLEGEPAVRVALATLGDADPANLKQATAAQKAAAAQLLWSVKDLFADLATQGQEVLARRLGVTGKADPAASARIGQLPADNIVLAHQTWLPGLLDEVAAHRRGETLPQPPAAIASPPSAAESAAPGAAVSAAGDDDLLLTDEPVAAPPATKVTVAPSTLAMADAEQRVAHGGWYRRDETYTLYYRPGGHADPFLTAWLETSAREKSSTATAIFAQLSAPGATGLCLKCHVVDQAPDGNRVNWRARQPQPEKHEFTQFKHSAHFSLVGDQGCMTCHIMDGESTYPKHFGANRDPAVFHSNFVPITRESCAACHRSGEAGMDCLLCHNYHTGEWRAPKVRASGFHPESVRKAEPAAAPAAPK